MEKHAETLAIKNTTEKSVKRKEKMNNVPITADGENRIQFLSPLGNSSVVLWHWLDPDKLDLARLHLSAVFPDCYTLMKTPFVGIQLCPKTLNCVWAKRLQKLTVRDVRRIWRNWIIWRHSQSVIQIVQLFIVKNQSNIQLCSIRHCRKREGCISFCICHFIFWGKAPKI